MPTGEDLVHAPGLGRGLADRPLPRLGSHRRGSSELGTLPGAASTAWVFPKDSGSEPTVIIYSFFFVSLYF